MGDFDCCVRMRAELATLSSQLQAQLTSFAKLEAAVQTLILGNQQMSSTPNVSNNLPVAAVSSQTARFRQSQRMVLVPTLGGYWDPLGVFLLGRGRRPVCTPRAYPEESLQVVANWRWWLTSIPMM